MCVGGGGRGNCVLQPPRGDPWFLGYGLANCITADSPILIPEHLMLVLKVMQPTKTRSFVIPSQDNCVCVCVVENASLLRCTLREMCTPM